MKKIFQKKTLVNKKSFKQILREENKEDMKTVITNGSCNYVLTFIWAKTVTGTYSRIQVLKQKVFSVRENLTWG